MKRPNAFWRRISNLLVAAVSVVVASCGPAPGPTIVDRLAEQVKRYPDMQTADAYKFVHQAAFGNGHLITDEAAARTYLRTELDSVSGGASEPLIEDVSPDGSVIRVNLRPFKAQNLDATKLADVMLESAKKFRPDREQFERWWDAAADAALRRTLPFDAAKLSAFGAMRNLEDYPAVHHSEIYAARYRPAYRVVLRAAYLATFR